MYFRRVTATVPLSALPTVRDGLVRVDAEVRRLAFGSEVAGMDEAVTQLLSTGGKRMRSVLLLLVHRTFGGVASAAEITGAAAVELVHVGSLAHDDLMDAATERRGVPTVNATWGPSMAVMVGDRLLAQAGQAALSVSPAVADALIQALVELIEGQTLEMTDAYDLSRSPDRALRSISLKTGALFRAGCVIGALCAGAEGERLEQARRFGERFGLAFQVLDDLLDLVSTTELLGKPVGNDLRQGTYTLPLLRALDRPELGWVGDVLADAGRELSEDQLDKVLTGLKQHDGFVAETLAYVRSLATEAAAVFPVGQPGPDTTVLRQLPEEYVSWAENLVAR
jgi:heptaprenyl diphosphate synthase/octaprenyl-diphosphate synthase